jgi:hypothetical protein
LEADLSACHIWLMIYSVQIVETRVVEIADGENAFPAYTLGGRFATIPLAEEAGNAVTKRLRDAGRQAFYHVLDPDGLPVGSTGPA